MITPYESQINHNKSVQILDRIHDKDYINPHQKIWRTHPAIATLNHTSDTHNRHSCTPTKASHLRSTFTSFSFLKSALISSSRAGEDHGRSWKIRREQVHKPMTDPYVNGRLMLTLGVFVDGKCYHIWHTWILWEI